MVSREDPAAARGLLPEMIDAGVTRLVLAPHPPYPPAGWLADEIIEPVVAQGRAPGPRAGAGPGS
jgi:hypothetical protein